MTLWIILAVANVPLYLLLGKAVFGDWSEFVECVKYWLTPDIISLVRGEWSEDWWAEFKLFAWALVCAGIVWGEHWVLTAYVL
ncbi:MAG: hypothetical protein R3B49_10605 [Phycisphaerales bacterium]